MRRTLSGTVLDGIDEPAAEADAPVAPAGAGISESSMAAATSETPATDDPPQPAARLSGMLSTGIFRRRVHPSEHARMTRAGRAAVALITVIAVTATVFATIFGWKLKDRDDLDTAARQASAAAQTYAVALTSIDSQHIDENFTTVLNGATGDFKNMYSQSSTQLKTLLVQNRAVSKGQVLDASIESASPNRVVVMLFVDQTITNSVSPDPRVDRSRILITMDRVGGRWLASKVEMV